MKQRILEKIPSLSEQQAEQFEVYYRMLVDWNSRINLTAITEPEDVLNKHFMDSLAAAPYILAGAAAVGAVVGLIKLGSAAAGAAERHHHETETKTNMSNLKQEDEFVKSKKKLSNAVMEGANNRRISNVKPKTRYIDQLTERVEDKIKDNFNK